jgi:hypothetical protein
MRKVMLSLFLVVMSCRAQKTATAGAKPSLAQLFADDQKDREHAMGMSNEKWQRVRARDAERRRMVRELLAEGPLPDGLAYKQAAFILQHGDKPEDYLLAHILASDAVAKGETSARWIAAATLDRYLQSIRQPQVYGTQYVWKHPGPKPKGATLEPYNSALLPDSLRRDACVATLEQQQENVRALDAGKDMPSPDGCRE